MGSPSARILLAGLVLLALTSLSAEAARKRKKNTSPALRTDRAALMTFKNAISDAGRSKISAWKARGNPCFPKPWPHITCSGGRVSSIDLSNLDIVGTLPARLRNLNRLRVLQLENNRFTGGIPTKWANHAKFRHLKTINLANNMLTGDLPNRKWNSRRALRSLVTLDLSQNSLSGGLPDGWMSTANVFHKLMLLDLSDNMLGFNSDGSPMASYTRSSYGWCLEGRTQDSGWCPTQVSKARAASLQVLDLSDNSLSGQLPSQWSQMFPELQFLLIQKNSFYPNGDAPAAPGALPDAWTRRNVPRAFPQLEALVLYPGNTMICSVLDLDTNYFSDINGATSYIVKNHNDQEFDAENPWFCPGPAADNPPTSVAVVIDENDNIMKLTWAAPVGDNMATLVFGYRVSLTKYDIGQEGFVLVPGWTARPVKVYGGNSDGLNGNFASGYTMDTDIVLGLKDVYQLQISTVNMDGVESSLVATNTPPPQCPVSAPPPCGSAPWECTCGPGYKCDPSTKLCLEDPALMLLAFKDTFTAWPEDFRGWSDPTHNPCGGGGQNKWTGIACSRSAVTEIDLNSKGVAGSLPTNGYLLPSTLESLDLGKNEINGTIPASWRLPQGLKTFRIGFNRKLTGSIPAEFAANLPATLDVFNVQEIGLTGTIPAFPNYKADAKYYLRKNAFTGSLPTWKGMTKTAEFYVLPGNTDLCGDVPGGSIEWRNGDTQLTSGSNINDQTCSTNKR